MNRRHKYPDSPLGPQLRPFADTFSVFALLRAHFGASGMEAPSGGETSTEIEGSTEGDSPTAKPGRPMTVAQLTRDSAE